MQITGFGQTPRGWILSRFHKLYDAGRLTSRVSCLLVGSACLAQTAAESRPATTNVDGAEYPRVYSDLSVEFRLSASTAQRVQVQIPGTTLDMTRAEDGTWKAKSAPMVPGFHYYSLVVDGVVVNDPASKTYFGIARES